MPINPVYRPRKARNGRNFHLRGIDYHLHEWGSPADAPLVMLHGWGDTGASFQFVVDELRRDWFVIAPDWRGFGDSSHNRQSYWFPDYLADLDELLTRYDFGKPVPLVGHSMGGNVAALYAGVFPERVAAFVNIEGFGLPDSDPGAAPARYRQWIEAARARGRHPGFVSMDALVARIRERSPRLSDERARFVGESWTSRDADGRLRLKADVAHRWPNPVLYRRAEAAACWRAITAPTLLVSGQESEFAAAANGWRAGDGLPVPGARALEIAGAGHMLHLEQPAALAAALEDFVGAALQPHL